MIFTNLWRLLQRPSYCYYNVCAADARSVCDSWVSWSLLDTGAELVVVVTIRRFREAVVVEEKFSGGRSAVSGRPPGGTTGRPVVGVDGGPPEPAAPCCRHWVAWGRCRWRAWLACWTSLFDWPTANTQTDRRQVGPAAFGVYFGVYGKEVCCVQRRDDILHAFKVYHTHTLYSINFKYWNLNTFK